ncbi:MAG TPA: hypothetical protein DEV81_13540 [Cyanobacteria bacterium UBA11049]|nr:hypothetical protein [Cyanobacteria bacterium UBA11049]
MRSLILILAVVLPGIAATSLSTYYLIPEWAVLEASYKNYQQMAKSPSSTMRELSIAEAAENRHRINCFAEGVGVLLGGVITAIGIHGCTQPRRKS